MRCDVFCRYWRRHGLRLNSDFRKPTDRVGYVSCSDYMVDMGYRAEGYCPEIALDEKTVQGKLLMRLLAMVQDLVLRLKA